MGLYWEAKAYDEEGNEVVVVYNPEIRSKVDALQRERAKNKKGPQKPLVSMKSTVMFDEMMSNDALSEDNVKILWGVVPGDIRLRPALTEEEKQANRAMLKQMLIEANTRVQSRHKDDTKPIQKPAARTKVAGAKPIKKDSKDGKGAKGGKVRVDGSAIPQFDWASLGLEG